MKSVHLRSDSYGSCYLGVYRGIDVVIKDLHVQQVQCESCEDAECEVPLLFGVCTKGAPYRLIMQFHGYEYGSSPTISSALTKKEIPDKITWKRILVKTAEALACVHKVGFLHNDLKPDNVVLDNKIGIYNPMVIDFGKSVPLSGAIGPKKFRMNPKGNMRETFHILHQKLLAE